MFECARNIINIIIAIKSNYISWPLFCSWRRGVTNWAPSPPGWVLKMSWWADIWKSLLGQFDCSGQGNVCSVDSTVSGFRASCWTPPRDTMHMKMEPWECTACTVSTLQATSSHCTMQPSPLYPQQLCNLRGVLKGNQSQISSDQGPYRPHFPSQS